MTSDTTDLNVIIANLIKSGYAVTSNRHCIVSRIDRSDWRDVMAKDHAPWDPAGAGTDWVDRLGDRAPDFYRRVYSKDNLTILDKWLKYMPKSSDVTTGFCHKSYDESNKRAQKEILIDMLKKRLCAKLNY